MTNTLVDASVVVTGASRGIGLAIAKALAAAGARVFCLARASNRLEEAVALLGAKAKAIACDLTDAKAIDAAVIAVMKESNGAPNVLVQAAGIFPLAPLSATPATEFESAMHVNLIGPYRLAQPIVVAMRERGSGHIVTIGSVADRKSFPENVAYGASKFGARAVHEVMREELRGTGVRTSLVSPGPVDTTIWDAIDPDSRPGFTPRALMLRPEAVAEAVRFVVTCSPEVNVDELRLSRA